MADSTKKMVAEYEVTIEGIARTRAELARLDNEIHLLRAGGGHGARRADTFVQKLDQLEGRVQTKAQSAMLAAMDSGKAIQEHFLNAAVTPTGQRRMERGRGGSAGRNDTGDMIAALARNVEVSKTTSTTLISGFHGWRDATAVDDYRRLQEKGTTTIKPANSLGQAIPPVREFLKRELGKLG